MQTSQRASGAHFVRTRYWFAAILLTACAVSLASLAAMPHVRAGQFPPPRDPRQAPQPTFRVQVELVQVDVIATDAQGRSVGDLQKADFEVLEDGKPQQVATFELVDIPITAGRDRATTFGLTAPDVRSNASDTGRVYLLVLDDMHTRMDKSSYARIAAQKFIERYLEPGDLAAVVFTSARRNVAQEFTSDRRLLLASVNSFLGMIPDPASGVVPPGPLAIADTARGVSGTLTALAQFLGRVSGRRKACVYLGPGFQITPRGGTPGALSPGEYQDLVAAANHANMAFYTIDPRGLSVLAEGATADAPSLDAAAALDAVDAAREGLGGLAADTGGFAVAGSNDLDRPFARIQRETSSYYLLGYYPAQQKEGSTHKIAVRVRRPGVRLRARSEYAVPKASASTATNMKARNVPAALIPALDNPLPNPGIRFSVAASAFKGAGNASPWAHVVIEIDGRDLDLSGKGGVDVAAVAVDKVGKIRGHDVRHVDLGLDPSTLSRVKQAGLRIHSRVPLEGGARTLRVAVSDGSTPRVGSLSLDLDVPDFDKAPVSMSGVLVTDGRATQAPTANVDEEFRKSLGAPASIARDFRAGDALQWLVEIYQKSGAARDMRVTTTITASDGRVVFTREERRPMSEPRNARGGVQVTGGMRLTDLPAGSYVLRIEASVAGEKQQIARAVPFRVEE
jgi:VWFA-related protein